MLRDLVIGLTTMVVCLILQALLIVFVVRHHARPGNRIQAASFHGSLAIVSGVMLLLVVGNLVQVGVWAALFRALGEFDEFRVAFYHSAVNFSTLGYGDLVMSPTHRLLGPLEAINGALMIGVTPAVLITAFQDVKSRAEK